MSRTKKRPETLELPTAPPPPPVITPKDIYHRLSEYVVGQEEAKKIVSIGAYQHLRRLHVNRLRRENPGSGKPLLKKSNMLLIGPTGSGKTHIARTLANIMDVPIVVVDATEYTEAGYYGKDVEVMIGELLHREGGDPDGAQQGIVFIDEFDKLASATNGMRTGAGFRDIGGSGVQQSLLKILEGDRVFAPINITQHWNNHEFVEIDTSDILFICAGAFSNLLGVDEKTVGGFTPNRKAVKAKEVQVQELVKYGFIPELLGRIPLVVTLDEHDADALVRIMNEPKDALLREFQDMLSIDGVTLEIEPEAQRLIAEVCLYRKLGARGLRGVMQKLLMDTFFEAPDATEDQTLVITPDIVRERIPDTKYVEQPNPVQKANSIH